MSEDIKERKERLRKFFLVWNTFFFIANLVLFMIIPKEACTIHIIGLLLHGVGIVVNWRDI